jgi:hypothetical protein
MPQGLLKKIQLDLLLANLALQLRNPPPRLRQVVRRRPLIRQHLLQPQGLPSGLHRQNLSLGRPPAAA